MGRQILLLLGTLSGVLFLSPPLLSDETENRDEQLLRQAGIAVDGESLLAFLRRRPERVAATPERIQQLVRQLGSENFQERERASKELVACGRPALQPLHEILQSRDAEAVSRARACIAEIEKQTGPSLHGAAMRLLLRVRPAEAIPELIEALDHPEALVRKEAYCTLCDVVGPKELPALLKAAKDKRPHVRAGAIGLSFKYKDQPKVWVPILLETLRDENAVVRRQAAAFLRHFGSEEGVVPALIEALKDKDATPPSEASVPKAAAWSLETLGSLARPAIPGLMELSKAGDKLNRPTATLALGRLGTKDKEILPPVVSFLVQLLEDKEQPVGNRKTAATALGLVGPDAKTVVPALREVLKDKDAQDPEEPFLQGIHNSVLWALGRIGPGAEAAVPDLAAFLEDKSRNRDGRTLAAEALGAIGPAARPAVPVLIEALKKDDHIEVRQAAAKALGAIGPAAMSAVPVLTAALKDEDPRVRNPAAKALGDIGPAAESAVPALTEALKHFNPSTRLAAVQALGVIGPAAGSAVPTLMVVTKEDPFPELRQAAGEALKKIEQKPE